MNNTIDGRRAMIPYQKAIHGVFNAQTGKYDLPEGGYIFSPMPIHTYGPSGEILETKYHPYPTTSQFKRAALGENHKFNRKGRTNLQQIVLKKGTLHKGVILTKNKTINIWHFPSDKF